MLMGGRAGQSGQGIDGGQSWVLRQLGGQRVTRTDDRVILYGLNIVLIFYFVCILSIIMYYAMGNNQESAKGIK